MTEFIFIKLSVIILSFSFVFLAWLSKKVVGHWLNPSSIFSLFWFLYSFVPLLLAFPVPIDPSGLMYIFIFNLCFVASTGLFNWRLAFAKNLEKDSASDVFDKKIFRICFYGASAICIGALVLGVITQGDMSIASFFVNPLMFAGEYAGKGYGGELKPSVAAQLGLATSYIVIVLGGGLYGAGFRKKHILFLAFTPSVLVMLLQSAKGLFFFSIFVFYAGVLISRLYDKSYYLATIDGMKKSVVYFSLIIPVILMSFLARGLQTVSDSAVIINRIIRFSISYSSGHLYAFSDWFSDRYFKDSIFPHTQENLSGGFYTLMSFFRMLGDDREITLGVYDVYYEHSFHIKTNIYTVFRGLITDFSLIGSLVFALFVGFVCNLFFYRLLCSKKNAFYIVFFIFFVGISYQTYIISTLMWVTIPFVFTVLTLFFWVYFSIYAKGKV